MQNKKIRTASKFKKPKPSHKQTLRQNFLNCIQVFAMADNLTYKNVSIDKNIISLYKNNHVSLGSALEMLTQDLETKNIFLSREGVHNRYNPEWLSLQKYDENKLKGNLLDAETIEWLLLCLDELFAKKSCTNTKIGSSYALKHEVSKLKDKYCENGNFIAAMLLKGYRMRVYFKSPNVYFNCSRTQLLQNSMKCF